MVLQRLNYGLERDGEYFGFLKELKILMGRYSLGGYGGKVRFLGEGAYVDGFLDCKSI